MSLNVAPLESDVVASDSSFMSKKIHMIFTSQKRLDDFAKVLLRGHHFTKYSGHKDDPYKSASQYIQKFLNQALGLDLIHADNTSKCVSLEVNIIDNEFKLGHKKINDALCVMLFANKKYDFFAEAITSRLTRSIFAGFPAGANHEETKKVTSNLHLRHTKGTGQAEVTFCLALLNSITFTDVDGDALETPEDIMSNLWGDGKYDLIRGEDYQSFGFEKAIATRWQRLLRGQKALLRGLEHRIMPYSPFGQVRTKFHRWLNKHCTALEAMEEDPHLSIQNSFNRITHLRRLRDHIHVERKVNSKLAYKSMISHEMLPSEPNRKDWEEIRQLIWDIYKPDRTRNHSVFSGLPKLQRKDSGFEEYCQFDAWELAAKKTLIYNLNPKFWRNFNLLNLAHTKYAKYDEDLDNPEPDEERKLNLTNIPRFNYHHSWICIMKEYKTFVERGGCIS